MPDLASLLRAVDRLADRFRSMPQSRLLASAGGSGGTRAEEGFDLAQRLAETAGRLEVPQPPPGRMPDEGVFVVGDQIAVAGHDLAAALAGCSGIDPQRAERVLETVLRDIAQTAERL